MQCNQRFKRDATTGQEGRSVTDVVSESVRSLKHLDDQTSLGAQEQTATRTVGRRLDGDKGKSRGLSETDLSPLVVALLKIFI